VRTVHWHAHPVATLAFESADVLHSAGEESVLVTWQLSRGMDRPAAVLPRMALSGISHVVVPAAAPPGLLLVHTADNALHLLEAHNRSLLWKVQGLAAGEARGAPLTAQHPVMHADPRHESSGLLALTGLSGAPGLVHWYDPAEQRVVQSLEVAPYNRVSRTDVGDHPMPTPVVTHAAWSQSGEQLVTVDRVPTENLSEGTPETFPGGASFGVVTTIRFWSRAAASDSYDLVAAMTHPHGRDHHVSALAISDDGNYACTVSNDERAFRLWRRVQRTEEEEEEEQEGGARRKTTVWTCRCRVTTPAGFSNFPTGRRAVAFSADASVLAVAHGNMVTLWDHHEVTLLSSLRRDDPSPIDSVQFLCSDTLADALLTCSSTSVAMQSPYGVRGPANFGWTWTLPAGAKHFEVCLAEFVPGNELAAIVLYDEEKNESRVVLVNALTGEPCKLQGAAGVMDEIPGKVVSVAATKSKRSSGTPPVSLFALSSSGELIALHNREAGSDTSVTPAIEPTMELLPALPLLQVSGDAGRKRGLSILDIHSVEETPSKKLSLEHFGSFAGDEGPPSVLKSTELPQLRGAFSRSFLGRHLMRRDE
jgi:NET1-associated nuclear protein 1 (U3 small nucleolar RNA-associated protein 17)